MNYVLILLLLNGNIVMQKFEHKQACENAAYSVMKKTKIKKYECLNAKLNEVIL